VNYYALEEGYCDFHRNKNSEQEWLPVILARTEVDNNENDYTEVRICAECLSRLLKELEEK